MYMCYKPPLHARTYKLDTIKVLYICVPCKLYSIFVHICLHQDILIYIMRTVGRYEICFFRAHKPACIMCSKQMGLLSEKKIGVKAL